MITPSLFFVGAWLAAAPVLLHLLMRQKPRHIEFPALRFLRKRHDANRRRLRLRHWLLLLLRMALIALVALALARPALQSTGGTLTSQKAPVAAILAFDTSKRMDYRHENRSRLEAAQPLASWLLTQLPPESELAVIDGHTPGGVLQVDVGAVRSRIERLETSTVARPMTQVVEEALRLAQTSRLQRKEIYVFTDLARCAWPPGSAESLARQILAAPDVGVQLIDVGVMEPVNDALGDLRLPAQVLPAGSPLRLDTELVCLGAGPGPGGQRAVELYVLAGVSGKAGTSPPTPQKRDQRIVDVDVGEARQVEFRISGFELGTHQGYVQLSGEDSLPIDNRRYFTVDVKPPWQVLVAAPHPVDRYSVYLRNVLAADVLRRQGQTPFECTVVPLDQLATRNLDPFAAVCVLDPKPLEGAVWRKLAAFAADGRGVGVFLGRNADPIDSFNGGAAQELLAGKLLRIARSPDENLYLAPREYEHPALAAFRGRAGQVPWFRHPVYRYWQLADVHEGVQSLVPYRDDEPAVLIRPVGKGRALTMTTPISDNPNRQPWNLLPVGASWPFLMLSNGLVAYLAGGDGAQLNYVAGQSVALELNPQWPFRSYVLTGPDGSETRLTPDLPKHRLEIQGTQQPGNYRVRAGGTADGVDRGFSVNLPAAATRLARCIPDDLTAFFGSPPRVARDREQIEVNISAGRVGRELFAAIILLAAACLAIEHVVANRFYREPEGPARK